MVNKSNLEAILKVLEPPLENREIDCSGVSEEELKKLLDSIKKIPLENWKENQYAVPPNIEYQTIFEDYIVAVGYDENPTEDLASNRYLKIYKNKEMIFHREEKLILEI